MDELLGEFITESSENMAVLDLDLITLESQPHNPDLISRIFRTLHTIKGTCGFIGLPQLEKVAHAGENVLGALRDGTIEPTSPVISIVLKCLDHIRVILNHLEKHQVEPEDIGQHNDLIEALHQAEQGTLKTTDLAVPFDNVGAITPFSKDLKREPETSPVIQRSMSQNVTPLSAEVTVTSHSSSEVTSSPKSIRVSVDLLENLMTMVSELVLTRNQLLQTLRAGENTHLLQPLQRLNTVTSELQDSVMKTRMQPIGIAWSKLPRLVRDLALDLHKVVELDLRGADTELDRQVLELIKDPLTHMVRNSLDHGIETMDERQQAGKVGPGRITMHAYHQGGHIIIDIWDNGRGINTQRVKEIALKKNLMSLHESETLTPAQIAQYIFLPGFSTASQVTSISGRGVGMDVVRNNIEKIGGTIELHNREGDGSQFKIKIPLTLTIISGLIVGVDSERFIIPQICIMELVHVRPKSSGYLETLHGVSFLRLREEILPVCYLDEILGLRAPRTLDDTLKNQNFYVVIMQVGSQTFGMIVDQVFETQEIVVKPVANFLKHISVYLGNAILGDGQVIMILDMNGISNRMIKATQEEKFTDKLSMTQDKEADKIPFLVFKGGCMLLKAVPLALISRLEEFNTHEIENCQGNYIVKYRDHLMPLLQILPNPLDYEKSKQTVLVLAEKNKFVGIMIDSIVDIVTSTFDIQIKSDVPALLGTTIIHEQITQILNVEHYIQKVFPTWSAQKDLMNSITFFTSSEKNIA